MTKKYRAALISLGSVSSKMTAEAMRKYFEHVDELQIKEIEVVLGQKEPVLYRGKPIEHYDCIYVKGSFRYAAIAQAISTALYKRAYLPIHPNSFTVVHDKLLTHVQLQEHDVPMPKTYLSSTIKAAKELLKGINYPVILKFPKGTQGKGVMFADSYPAASSVLDALQTLNQALLIQEYMETSGEDIRVFVIGDKVVAAIKRRAASGEKRSNLHAGGSAEAFEPSAIIKKIALATAKSIKSDVCGVDILETAKGPVVIEANISPGLQGITAVSGKDVAGAIAKYLYERTDAMRSQEIKPAAQELIDDIADDTSEKVQSVVGPLDYRGNRILLPEMATLASGIKEDEECTVTSTKGRIEVRKGI